MRQETSLPGVLKVRNLASATVIADAITVADTSLRRAIGLLRHKRLEQGAGIWIRPCSGVHTFGMSFAIDVIGLDKNRCVVRLWPELRPNRMTAIYPSVRTVLEVASGTIAASGIALGDQLILE
jgi:uncharacterized membrane protein (UPF0127 family)